MLVVRGTDPRYDCETLTRLLMQAGATRIDEIGDDAGDAGGGPEDAP